MEVMGVFDWALWEKEVSEFPWEYKMTEFFNVVEGEATFHPEAGDPGTKGRGVKVIFSKGRT